MEGTLDSRLILQRPEPRQNVVEDRNILRISHTRPAAPAKSATPVAVAAPVQPAAPVASVVSMSVAPQPLSVPAVAPTPQPVIPQTPSFSQVTPVYAPTPKNTPADIVQPPVKSMEWVQKPYVQPVAPVAPVQPLSPVVAPLPSPAAPLQVDREPAPAIASPEIPTMPSKLDVIEKNISDVDLDQMIDTRNPQPEAALPTTEYSNPFVIPATPQSISQPSFQPVVPTAPLSPVQPIQPLEAPVAPVSEIAQPATPMSAFDQYFQNTAPVPTKSSAGFASAVGATFGALTSKLKTHARATAIVAIVAVVGMGSYVLADSLLINQRAKQTLATETTEQPPAPVFGGGVVEEETDVTEEAEPVVEEETTDPTPNTANSGVNLSVAAGAPQSIIISKLGINAPVIGLGLTAGGAIDTPANIWHAGWYNKSAKPGTPGATFIDGHSSAEGGALFGQLNKVTKGDTFQVVRGDGKTITYVVVEKKRVDRNNVDMASMLRPYGDAEHGLNIMTCIGTWIPAEQTLTDRLLVYAIEV